MVDYAGEIALSGYRNLVKATLRKADFTGLAASCDVVWGLRITYGLPTIQKLSCQTTSNAGFHWRFAGLGAIYSLLADRDLTSQFQPLALNFRVPPI